MLKNKKAGSYMILVLGSAIQAFGLYHVHSCSGVTEGGVLGLILLLKQWFDVSPAVSGAVLNIFCYLLGWKLLGRQFIIYSLVSTAGFSASYKVFEQFPLLWPQLYDMPLVAAVLGALFVGIGVGICVRIGGAPGGDDALAMSISHATGMGIEKVYLISDLVVLGMSGQLYSDQKDRIFPSYSDTFGTDHWDYVESREDAGNGTKLDWLKLCGDAAEVQHPFFACRV